MEDNFDCDKDYAKGWMSSKDYESKNMSGSSHSSDSHGVYSAYSAGNLRCGENTLPAVYDGFLCTNALLLMP